eukprot:7136731-Prymnesium_polylepis.1
MRERGGVNGGVKRFRQRRWLARSASNGDGWAGREEGRRNVPAAAVTQCRVPWTECMRVCPFPQ